LHIERNMSQLPPDAPRPRLCHIIKSNPEQEYGFDLHAEKVRGQFIGNVDDDSPAGRSGLRRGDRILAVNGVLIVQENHKDVVKRIKEDPMQCTLVVLDEEGVAWYNERKLQIPIEGEFIIDVLAEREAANKTHEIPTHLPPTYNDVVHEEEREVVHHPEHSSGHLELQEIREEIRHFEPPAEEMHQHFTPHFEVPNDSNNHAFKPRPRLCKLKKTEPGDEFGFNLHAERGKGHFIGKVDNDSIAERAGLEEGQRIVGVNETLIYPNTPHKDVVNLIKQNSKATELLVVFPEVDNWYREKAVEYSYDDAETVQSDEIAHKHPLKSTENGKVDHHVEHAHVKDHEIPNEDVLHVKVDPVSEFAIDAFPSSHHKEVTDKHEEIKHEHVPIVETSRFEPEPKRQEPSPSAHVVKTHQYPQQPNGAPNLFSLSAAEMREQLRGQRKPDPRKSDTSNLSLQQKYDIIQSL